MTDDGWTPFEGDTDWRAVHPDALGVSGYTSNYRRDPDLHLFVPLWERVYRRLVCRHCGSPWGLHWRLVANDWRELRRRRGKTERPCPRCLATGHYIDARGTNPFRSCPRCTGWGRVWEG